MALLFTRGVDDGGFVGVDGATSSLNHRGGESVEGEEEDEHEDKDEDEDEDKDDGESSQQTKITTTNKNNLVRINLQK